MTSARSIEVDERPTVVHWFRSDLRLTDNLALAAVCRRAARLAPIFVFDDALIASGRQGEARIRFMRRCVERLADDLAEHGQRLIVRRGDPVEEVLSLVEASGARVVTWNRDATPYARARDVRLEQRLAERGVRAVSFKDRVVHEARDVAPVQNRTRAVFSPYRKAWWRRFESDPPAAASILRLPPAPDGLSPGHIPSEADLGIENDRTEIPEAGERAAQDRLRGFLSRDAARYKRDRDFPALEATSRLSPYLRFGVLSIRTCLREARDAIDAEPDARRGLEKWIDELVWREFYQAILDDDPSVLHRNYRSEFDAFEWEQDDAGFEAWCAGETGFPFVDAGIRELRATGHMHNRLRMVVASFLTKDLLIDWRRGERFFMQRLVDGDPGSNNGGWQWAASTGTDAQEVLRVFNPVLQGERFDPDGNYVRRWIPELSALPGATVHRPWEMPLVAPGYPAPCLDHAERRRRAIERFARVGA